MRRPTSLRSGLLSGVLLGALWLAACGDNLPAQQPPPADAATDADPAALGPCLERPTDLARPPTGALPCELLPPDFAPVRQ